MKENLNDFKRDITSAGGEDGIIEEIVKRLGIEAGTSVEFGAADGYWNSNTYSLWTEKGWNAVLIESSRDQYEKMKQRIQDLSPTFREGQFVAPVNTIVCPDPAWHHPRAESLQNIIERLNGQNPSSQIEKNFDLLSIDIDGNDYYAWKSFDGFEPKCVVVEYNKTIPPNIEFVDDLKTYLSAGASIKSFNKLAKEKGYTIVACTGSNLIFVHNDYVGKLGDITTDVRDLFDLSYLNCIVSTQVQDRVYMTKRRPTNYNMTFDEMAKAYGTISWKQHDENKVKDYKGLYPIQAYYDYTLGHADPIVLDKNSSHHFRIIDNHVVFKLTIKDEPKIYTIRASDLFQLVAEGSFQEFVRMRNEFITNTKETRGDL